MFTKSIKIIVATENIYTILIWQIWNINSYLNQYMWPVSATFWIDKPFVYKDLTIPPIKSQLIQHYLGWGIWRISCYRLFIITSRDICSISRLRHGLTCSFLPLHLYANLCSLILDTAWTGCYFLYRQGRNYPVYLNSWSNNYN